MLTLRIFMPYYRFPKILLFLVSSSFFFITPPAWSQPPSMPAVDQATKAVDRSIRDKAEKELMKAPSKPARPKEEPIEVTFTGPKVFVKSIELEGVETFPEEDFRPILAKYENREVFESELKDGLTKEITREYLKRGVIAACFIPPHEITEGVVKLQVIESKMGNLEVTKARFYPRDRLKFYWPIKAGKVLRYDKISRALQFMNKNPDREVKATLLAGKNPGTTDVLLDQKDKFPIHVTASLDNEGSVSTGKMRTGAGLVDNNALGLDDTMLAGYSGADHSAGWYIYHKLPVSSFGTNVVYGYSRTTAEPAKEFKVYDIGSEAETASAFVYQDIYQKDNYMGAVYAGIDAKNKHVVSPPLGGTLNVDKLRIVRTGISLINRDGNAFTYIKPQLSQGLNFLGALRKNEFSSRGAGNTFSTFNLDAQFVYRFKNNIRSQVRFTGQAASEKLTPQEELFMGGIDSVRGYPSGDFLADTGFASNFELLVPAFFLPDTLKVPYGERPLKDEITGVFFFDYGCGQKRGQIQGEQNYRRMASVGAGVRIRVLNQADLRLEWAVPLDPMVNRRLTEGGGNRPWLHFSLNFQDNLPEEAARLLKLLGR